MSHLYRHTTMLRIVLCSVLLFAQLPLTKGQGSAATELKSVEAQEASQESSALVPIVFVPGTAGSELRLTNRSKKITDKLYWLGPPTFKKNGLAAAALNKYGRDLVGNQVEVAKEPLAAIKPPITSEQTSIYSNFLVWARTVFPGRFYVAPYDWRKGAGLESSELLDKLIDQARHDSQQDKVIILAHSLGGLVSRDYILRKGSHKVAALIAVGTPWLGLPKAVRALVWGYNFEAGTVKPGGTINIDGLPPNYTSSMCSNGKCKYLKRRSFLKREDVLELAHNFPSVYQQLPTEAFMKEYGHAANMLDGRPAGNKDFKTVLLGKDTWEKMRAFYFTENSDLFTEAETWRFQYISRKNVGVKHYLIGGIYAPGCRDGGRDCKIENRMDMQMANPHQVSKSNFSKFFSTGTKVLNILLSVGKYSAHVDPFVALDSDYEWGDGTTPLLSATAGEYVRSVKAPANPGEAAELLGDNAEAQAVELGAKFGHSAMLDDPNIRKLILKNYKTESQKLSRNSVIPEDVAAVCSIEIKISAASNGVKNVIRTALIGPTVPPVGPKVELVESDSFTSDKPIKFKSFEVVDSRLVLPRENPKPSEKPEPQKNYVRRTLLTSEIPNLTLQLRASQNSGLTLHVTSIEVVVNGILRFQDKNPFDLISGQDRAFSLAGEVDRTLLSVGCASEAGITSGASRLRSRADRRWLDQLLSVFPVARAPWLCCPS